jgi:hypothetical protein
MSDLCRLIWCALIGLFRPRAAMEAENLVFGHQLNVLRRKSPKPVALSNTDRLLLVGLYRLARHRCRTDHGRKVYGEDEATAVRRVGKPSSAIMLTALQHGPVPGSYDFVSGRAF